MSTQGQSSLGPLAGAGDYVREVVDGAHRGVGAFSSDGSANIDGGTIRLRLASRFTSSANVVVAQKPEVLPGEAVELRASWQNDSPEAVPGAVARVTVPTGTTLVPGSLTVGGVALPTTPDVVDGAFDVPVGNVAPGQGGALRYRLRADAGVDRIVGAVSIKFDERGPTREEHLPDRKSVV